MPDFFLDLALISTLVLFWTLLGRSRLGRIVQAIIASSAYFGWLAIIPLTAYFVASGIAQEVNEGRTGAAVFVALVSLTLIPMLLLPLIPWNYFCGFVWRKTGLRLPQTDRLGGRRAYYASEREQ
jgi:hypothetical protein